MEVAPEPTGRVGSRVWWTALSAGLASYLDAATLISVSISLAIWRDHFGLGVWQVGVLSAGLTLFVAVGSVVGGRLGDRLGRGRVFGWDLAVFVVGTVVILTAGNGTMLTLGVMVVGLAAGADIPTSLAVIADTAPDGARGRLVALTQVLWIAGILVTFGLGFAVSGLGFAGTRILTAHLVLVAVVTLTLRLLVASRTLGHPPTGTVADPSGRRLRLRDRRVRLPVAATGLFFVFWNIAASTLGSYGTYYLVTRTGLGQGQATALALLGFPPALVLAIAYTRLADSAWRDRLFVLAMPVQVAAFGLGAVTGGTVVWGMVGLVLLYSLSNVFAGEAAYKVWAQQLLPNEVRATALGVSYGVARAVAAGFLVLVPALVERRPGVLLWILTGCVVLSGATGLVIVRHPALLGDRRPAGFPDRRPARGVEP